MGQRAPTKKHKPILEQVQTYLEPVMKRSQQQTQTTSTGHVPVGSATKSRRGFTMVELLVVMAIIGILVGMLAVAMGPILRTVYNGAVTTEMKQLELAIEDFNNQHGFYPPTFSMITGPGDLVPYLNKISPNHREVSSGRLAVWYAAIGTHLDDRTSLVFWLSAINSNKQFPITGGLADRSGGIQLPVAFGGSDSIVVDGSGNITLVDGSPVNRAVNGSGAAVEIPRDSFFDFRGGQLSDFALDIACLLYTSDAADE